MINVEPNNFTWKNKLDDVNSLSAETLTDKNAAWLKLHNRLRPKPRRIKVIWYWAAAACLLVAIITPFSITNKKQFVAKKDSSSQTQSKKINVLPVAPLKEIELVNAPSTSKEKMSVTSPAKQITGEVFIPGESKKETTTSIALNDIMDGEPLQTIVTPPVLDAAAPKLAVTTRKLKVVHINELGDPVEEPQNMVYIADHRLFQARLINSEVFIGTPSPLSTGFNIFKTKNTPPN